MEKKFKLWIFITVIISLIYLAITNRYIVQPTHNIPAAIKYDRWTGQTKLLTAGQTYMLDDETQELEQLKRIKDKLQTLKELEDKESNK